MAGALISHDLKTGLFRAGRLQENLFWKKYKTLDTKLENEEIKTYEILWDYQIEHLKAYERAELGDAQQKQQYALANKFILNAPKEMKNVQNGVIEEQASKQIYARVLELFNAGLVSSDLNPLRYKKVDEQGRVLTTAEGKTEFGYRSKAEMAPIVDNILQEIQPLLQQINLNGPTETKIVQALEHRLRNMSQYTTKTNIGTKDYVNEKADWSEEIAETMLTNDDFIAKQTGIWTNGGAALIEDVMAFSRNQLTQAFNKAGIGLQFSIELKNAKSNSNNFNNEAHNLQEFFNKIENIDKSKYTIKLSNELYEALKQASALSAQVKSGNTQDILTTAARNALQLNDIGMGSHELWKIYTHRYGKAWFKDEDEQQSKDLAAIANYYLSISIAKTALSRNQIYFTAQGLVSASRWMELMGRLLIFSPPVEKIGVDFLTAERPYRFASKNKN